MYSEPCLSRSRISRISPKSKVYTRHHSFTFYCFLPHISQIFSKSKLFLQSQEIRLRQGWLYFWKIYELPISVKDGFICITTEAGTSTGMKWTALSNRSYICLLNSQQTNASTVMGSFSILKPMYSFGKWWKWEISLMGFVYRVVWFLKVLWIFLSETNNFLRKLHKTNIFGMPPKILP